MTMENRGNIEEYFRQRLADAEMDVNPQLWGALEQALINKAASSATASFGLAKVAGALAFSGLIAVASINEVQYHTQLNLKASKIQDAVSMNGSPEKTIDLSNQEATISSKEEKPNSNAIKAEQKLNVQLELISSVEADDKDSRQIKAAEAGLKTELDKVSAINEQMTRANGIPQNVQNEEMPELQSELNILSASKSQGNSSISEPEVELHVEPEMVKQIAPPANEPKKAATTVAKFTHEAVQTITPNGDMYNEFFAVEGFDVEDFHIRIMTREGALVTESKDLNFRWNGLDRFGNPVPSGTYFYQIAAVGTDGLPYLEKNARGSIQVIRD